MGASGKNRFLSHDLMLRENCQICVRNSPHDPNIAGFPGRLPLPSTTTASPGAPFSAPGVLPATPSSTAAAAAAPKKTGKWNAMHVRIAWEIYNHQQKAKNDSKPGGHPAASIAGGGVPPKHGFDLLNKSGGPPGADFLGKRPGPPQDLIRAHNPSSLYGGSLGLPAPPNPFDPLSARDPFGAQRFYGSSPLGKSKVKRKTHLMTPFFSSPWPSRCLPSVPCARRLPATLWWTRPTRHGAQQSQRTLRSHHRWPTCKAGTPWASATFLSGFTHGSSLCRI